MIRKTKFNLVNIFLFINVSVFFIWLICPKEYFDNNLTFSKAYSLTAVVYFILSIISFCIGAMSVNILSKRYTLNRKSIISIDRFDIDLIGRIGIRLAYVSTTIQILWYIIAIIKFGVNSFIAMLLNKNIGIQNVKVSVFSKYSFPGITTLVFLSITAVILYTYYLLIKNDKNELPDRLKIIKNYIIIFIPGLLRGIFSERMALFEIFFAMGYTYIVYRYYIKRKKINLMKIFLSGFILTICFITVFSLAESLRSYRVMGGDTSILNYGIKRLFNYFITGINNFVAYVYVNGVSKYNFPVNTLSVIYATFNLNSNVSEFYSSVFSSSFGSAEYNVFTLIGYTYVDLSMYGFVITYFLGIILSILDNLNIKKNIYSVLISPVVFITILDSFRTFLLTTSRGVIPILSIIVVIGILKRRAIKNG